MVYDYDGNSSRVSSGWSAWTSATGAAATIVTGVGAPFRLLGGGRIIYRQPSDDGVERGPVAAGRRDPDADPARPRRQPLRDHARRADRRVPGPGRGRTAVRLDASALVWRPSDRCGWPTPTTRSSTAEADGAGAAGRRPATTWPREGAARGRQGAGPPACAPGRAAARTRRRAGRPPVADPLRRDPLLRPADGRRARSSSSIGPPGGWRMTGAPDHVFLSRRKGTAPRALRIEGATTRATPAVLGGPELDGASPAPGGGFVALVAQDTDNDGTTEDERDEVDVCRLPAAGEVRVPVRHVPRRIAGAEARLAALAHAAGAARWSVIEDPPGPMTVQADLREPTAATTSARLRARVRDLARDHRRDGRRPRGAGRAGLRRRPPRRQLHRRPPPPPDQRRRRRPRGGERAVGVRPRDRQGDGGAGREGQRHLRRRGPQPQRPAAWPGSPRTASTGAAASWRWCPDPLPPGGARHLRRRRSPTCRAPSSTRPSARGGRRAAGPRRPRRGDPARAVRRRRRGLRPQPADPVVVAPRRRRGDRRRRAAVGLRRRSRPRPRRSRRPPRSRPSPRPCAPRWAPPPRRR